jgi:hypothetical protein
MVANESRRGVGRAGQGGRDSSYSPSGRPDVDKRSAVGPARTPGRRPPASAAHHGDVVGQPNLHPRQRIRRFVALKPRLRVRAKQGRQPCTSVLPGGGGAAAPTNHNNKRQSPPPPAGPLSFMPTHCALTSGAALSTLSAWPSLTPLTTTVDMAAIDSHSPPAPTSTVTQVLPPAVAATIAGTAIHTTGGAVWIGSRAERSGKVPPACPWHATWSRADQQHVHGRDRQSLDCLSTPGAALKNQGVRKPPRRRLTRQAVQQVTTIR